MGDSFIQVIFTLFPYEEISCIKPFRIMLKVVQFPVTVILKSKKNVLIFF